MMGNEVRSQEEQAKQLLSQLNAYAREHNLSNRQLAEELSAPHNTLDRWWFFSHGKGARKPSEPHLNAIKEFLEAKSEPEVYVQINVPSNKRLDRNQREITFTCKFCGKPKPIEEMRIITRFFPPLPACRDCFKLMD